MITRVLERGTAEVDGTWQSHRCASSRRASKKEKPRQRHQMTGRQLPAPYVVLSNPVGIVLNFETGSYIIPRALIKGPNRDDEYSKWEGEALKWILLYVNAKKIFSIQPQCVHIQMMEGSNSTPRFTEESPQIEWPLFLLLFNAFQGILCHVASSPLPWRLMFTKIITNSCGWAFDTVEWFVSVPCHLLFIVILVGISNVTTSNLFDSFFV